MAGFALPPDARLDLPVDQRSSPRIALLLRAAKLICGSEEYLCVLRDISTSGIRARLFHALPCGQEYILELANGDRLTVEPVWERDKHAGFRFAEGGPTIHSLLEEAGDFPKRQLRLRVDLPVELSSQGMALDAVMVDLAQHGAKLSCSTRLALGQPVAIEGAGFPPLAARVRWRRGAVHGLVFHTGFRLDSLAELVFRIHHRRPDRPKPLDDRANGTVVNQ